MAVPYVTVSAQIDLRGLSGQTIFQRSTDLIDLPTFADDEGVYLDIYDLAHSRGSFAAEALAADRLDIQSVFAAWDASVRVTITGTDRISILGPAAFTVTANPDFGFTSNTSSSVGIGGHIAVADAAWSRDVVKGSQLTITVMSSTYTAPASDAYHAQNVATLIRRRERLSAGDGGALGPFDIADIAGATCLEAVDNAGTAGSDNLIRHYIDHDGHYVMAWPTSLGLDKPVWSVTSLRDLLGYSGTESLTTEGDVTVFKSDKPARRVLSTARAWKRRPQLISGEEAEVDRLVLGGAAVAHVSSWTDVRFEFWLDGPDSSNPDDLVAHYIEQVLPYMPRGYPLTVTIGRDLRFHVRPDDIASGMPAASLLYSADVCSGCWRRVRSPDDSPSVTPEYDDNLGGEFWAEASLLTAPPRPE